MGTRSPGPEQGVADITLATANLASPTIAIHLLHETLGTDGLRSPGTPSLDNRSTSSPGWQSPIRQHRRTPSIQREVKETLDARSEYMSDEEDGQTHHRVNQYTIKEEIGRGSYGAVSLAADQFGNKYAMKEFSKTRLRKRAQSHILRNGPRRVLNRTPAGEIPISPPLPIYAGLAGQNTAEARDALFLIREEIAIMKKLNHPNLVQLIEVLDDPEEDSLYMVMEMCEKGVVMKVSLEEEAKPYDEEICRYWFRDLMLGIEYLHHQGVIHRDIKPDNLLLSEDEVLKIVDFGVSEMFEKPDDMRTAKSAGSPAFLPPELCVAHHGNVSGKAADIWSMGVTLYCLRFGRIPFRQIGVLQMYEAIKNEIPELPENESPEFRDLMARILDKDPNKRITMDELREHAWVTRNGSDPLLCKEENCAEPIEPPNALELSRAITRKMNHLMCVMKSIQRFKSLLHKRHKRTSTPTTLSPMWHPFHVDEERSKAVDIEAILQQRRNFMSSRKAGQVPTPIRVDSNGPHSPFLGIGNGTSNDPSAVQSEGTSTGVGSAADASGNPIENEDEGEAFVAESPTAVDFNVYDRAYQAEVERIQTHAARKDSKMYLTRLVGNRSQLLGVNNLITVGGGASAANTPRLGPVDRVGTDDAGLGELVTLSQGEAPTENAAKRKAADVEMP